MQTLKDIELEIKTTLDNGGYTEEARKRHNKRDIAKHVKQSRAKRYR